MCQVNNASWCLDVVDCVVRIVASLVENWTKHATKLVAYVILGVAHATSQNGSLHLLELHMQSQKLVYYKCYCSYDNICNYTGCNIRCTCN